MPSDNIFFNPSDLKFLGKNVIVGKTVRIRRPELVSIDTGTIIDDFTYISCGLSVGKYTHIGPGVHIIGGPNARVIIGDFVNIGPGCKIIAGQHNYRGGGLMGPAIPKKYCSDDGEIEPIKISNHVLLGCGTVVLPGVEIPEGMATGAYTILKKKEYASWTLYVGHDAREISKRIGLKAKETASELMNDPEYWI